MQQVSTSTSKSSRWEEKHTGIFLHAERYDGVDVRVNCRRLTRAKYFCPMQILYARVHAREKRIALLLFIGVYIKKIPLENYTII